MTNDKRLRSIAPIGAESMLPFHISIHARPAGIHRGSPLLVNGREVVPIDVQQHQLSSPLPVSFEVACEQLSKLPRMFCEPDGSFVWVADDRIKSWQVDGNLYDGPAGLMYVDLRGSCPAQEFNRLLRCFGGPETPLIFQFVREAIFLDEEEGRRWVI